MLRRLAPELLVFLLALGVRLAYLFGLDEPLGYPHHFARALQIAAHPDPVGYIWGSDGWRVWGTAGSGGWTLAPLYYVFAAGVAGVFGPQLRPLQVVQCLLEALTAVGVARLGRVLVGPVGVSAGFAYALHWQAIVFHSGVDTENLHTVLLVWGVALLAGAASGGVAASASGGFLLGLSALARGVTLAFLPFAALWQWRMLGGSRGLRRAALTLGCSLLVVLPWAVRNYRLNGEIVPIETVSIYNLWNDNAFVDEGRWGRQARLIGRQPSFAGKQAEALRFALRGWARDPGAGLRKVVDGLEYFLRPSDAHELLIAEVPRPFWQHALAIGLGDALFALGVLLAAAFVVAGSRAPPRTLVLVWIVYYVVLLVVVFHTQVRYRTAFTPFLFACATGGLGCLTSAARERRRAAIGVAAALALVCWASARELRAAGRALAAGGPLRSAQKAVEAGELERAASLVGRAAERDPGSARPHSSYGRWLLRVGRTAEASHAYQRAAAANPSAWLPRVVLPRLLADAGRPEDAERALSEAHDLSRRANPWLALEAAWRELPPPRTNEILLGGLDYGAVRGFMAPEGGHRWSRATAWLRLQPLERAARYEITIEMRSPEPSPIAHPEVQVRAGGEAWRRFVLDRDRSAFQMEAIPASDGVVLVELRAPTWTRPGYPPELGVCVHRLVVRPAR
jgi:tetratricopeptide (TPR) repeat protein